MENPVALPPLNEIILRERKVLQLAWANAGTKALEAVIVHAISEICIYYQVTHIGKEVLQTVDKAEAERKYADLT